MLVSELFGVARSLLCDPSPGVYWQDSVDFLPYVNQFQRFACGIKPDLYPIRVTQALVSGVDQTIPTDGHTFLKPYTAGNGQAVFLMDLEDAKHSKFANLAAMTASLYPQVCFFDPISPRRFRVGPPATAGGTLEYDYGAIPPNITAITDPYLLGPETVDACTDYLMYLALRKNTDMQDLQRAKEFRDSCLAWFGIRTQAQAGEKPSDDQ